MSHDNYDLYDGTPPHERESPTSKVAAEMLRDDPAMLGRLQRIVLDTIRAAHFRGGISDDGIEQVTGLKHQTASARRRELYLKGLIRSSGQVEYSPEGRPRILWVMKEEESHE